LTVKWKLFLVEKDYLTAKQKTSTRILLFNYWYHFNDNHSLHVHCILVFLKIHVIRSFSKSQHASVRATCNLDSETLPYLTFDKSTTACKSMTNLSRKSNSPKMHYACNCFIAALKMQKLKIKIATLITVPVYSYESCL